MRSIKRFPRRAPPRRICEPASSVFAVDAHICVKPENDGDDRRLVEECQRGRAETQ